MVALPVRPAAARFELPTAVLRTRLAVAKSGRVNGRWLPADRPHLEFPVRKRKEHNNDEPSDTPGYESVGTGQQRLEKGTAEVIQSSCDRVREIDGRRLCGRGRVGHAVPGDQHNPCYYHRQCDEPQGTHGEMVGNPAEENHSERKSPPDEPRIHIVPHHLAHCYGVGER
jgi:hypothetical protein